MGNERAEKIKAFTDWAIQTCLLFGSEVQTAYKVGAVIAEGLERDLPTPPDGS